MWTSRVTAMLACSYLVGCGANVPHPAETRSACDLITPTEASEIAGTRITSREMSRNATGSTCSYKSQDSEFQLKVHWSGGGSAWEDQQRAAALGGKLLGADRGTGAAGVMRAEGVQLGDKASYNAILGAFVLKGDVLLEFNGLVTMPDARAKWEKLARKALARIHQ